jgi:regulator of protease activity HflC (stomatin/prohibitin superfamily)
MNNKTSETWTWVKIITVCIFMVLFISALFMVGCPRYNVWQQGLEGQAELARATQNRQIKIQESQAKADAAKYDAEAEITRARGAAKANEIIGQSLKGNEAYLHYLWINALNERAGEQTIVYVPTEANIPIMEAGRSK